MYPVAYTPTLFVIRSCSTIITYPIHVLDSLVAYIKSMETEQILNILRADDSIEHYSVNIKYVISSQTVAMIHFIVFFVLAIKCLNVV